MKRSGLGVLFLCVACSPMPQGKVGLETALPADRQSEAAVQMVAECGRRPADPRIMGLDSALVGAEGNAQVCVDLAEAVAFESAQARIYLRLDGGATLQLGCRNSESHLQFREMHDGKRAVLIAGGEVLGVYWLSSPIEGIPCGQFEFNALDRAVDYCELLAAAWGVDTDGCLNFCKDDEGICVSHAAAPRVD